MEDFAKGWLNNSKLWFSKTVKIDNYITDKYEYLLDLEPNITDDNFLSYIILYDQVPRHVFRNQYANHIILYFLNKAIDIINIYIDDVNKLNTIEWSFFMLPLRHTNVKDNILYVLNEAWDYKPLPKEFIIATYNKANFKEKLNESISFTFNNNVLDYNPDKHIITNLNYNMCFANFNLIEKYINKIGIISLSGGVDSMVCLVYSMIMYPNINWVCVHINYKNRKVADDEAEFVANFCYKHNIKLYVREINEINRNKCMLNDMREIYEDYTRKIRFNTYRAVCDNPIVVLGHNKDDAFENILTNITYSSKYNNLKGMEEHCIYDNITFLRPLLNVPKNDIYKFAQDHCIPYVKNSTPEWSQRGKIRNNIIPVLNNWDKRVVPGLFNLSDNIQDMYLIMESNVNIIINKFKKNEQNYEIQLNHTELTNYLHKLIWRQIIYKLFNCYPSNKSLIALIDRLNLWLKQKKEINKYTKIVINKHIIMEITQLTNEPRKSDSRRADENNNINIVILFNN
jgi:tRNA(Ile)-lysidine synthetase-like protein